MTSKNKNLVDFDPIQITLGLLYFYSQSPLPQSVVVGSKADEMSTHSPVGCTEHWKQVR